MKTAKRNVIINVCWNKYQSNKEKGQELFHDLFIFTQQYFLAWVWQNSANQCNLAIISHYTTGQNLQSVIRLLIWRLEKACVPQGFLIAYTLVMHALNMPSDVNRKMYVRFYKIASFLRASVFCASAPYIFQSFCYSANFTRD